MELKIYLHAIQCDGLISIWQSTHDEEEFTHILEEYDEYMTLTTQEGGEPMDLQTWAEENGYAIEEAKVSWHNI